MLSNYQKLIDDIFAFLQKNLPRPRLNHTLGTERIAADLARIQKRKQPSLDGKKVSIAALLHDCARGMNDKALINYVKHYNLRVTGLAEIVAQRPVLLHSYVGADIARRKFRIRDRQIIRAITSHTTGASPWDSISKIIYLADMVAPDRRYAGVKDLRKLVYRNLDTALIVALEKKISYVLSRKGFIHPGTILAWNSLVIKN